MHGRDSKILFQVTKNNKIGFKILFLAFCVYVCKGEKEVVFWLLGFSLKGKSFMIRRVISEKLIAKFQNGCRKEQQQQQ